MSAAISAIMVSWQTGPVLFDAIDAVLSDPDIKELIVVDHENPPEARARMDARSERDARLIILRTNQNLGFGRGNNMGAAKAAGDFLFFVNPDARPEAGAVRRLLSALQGAAGPAIVGACILDQAGQEQSGSRRNELTLWRALVAFIGLDRLEPAMGPTFKPFGLHASDLPDHPIEVGAVSGAGMLISKDDFLRLGGFDEGYFLHVEDIDLCRRARTVIFVPDAIIHHIGGSSDASRLGVQWAKAKSFLRYFWKFERSLLGRLGTLLLAPFIVIANLARGLVR